MKTVYEYICEADESKKSTQRGDIKFTIWETPDKKVKWLENNKKYQKIEYQLKDYKKNMFIDFLLGYKQGEWKLWIGKIGRCSYADDPYCGFDTKDFAEAIVACLDKVEEFVKEVKANPTNYVQFYNNR